MPHVAPELLVADSFLVRTGPASGLPEARAAQLHFERFRAASIAAWSEIAGHQDPAPAHARLESFLSDALARIAQYGAGWPRLELWWQHEDPESTEMLPDLRLALRPPPTLGQTLTCRTHAAWTREHPERKGPNIAAYAALNRELGGEVLLTDADGCVIEGSTTSLLWWNDNTLCTSAHVDRVPSVTERLILSHARSRGVAVLASSVDAASLSECETWAVNALHGIRQVTHIDERALPSPDASRLRDFQFALEASWAPIEELAR